jgi:hypothetical protein
MSVTDFDSGFTWILRHPRAATAVLVAVLATALAGAAPARARALSPADQAPVTGSASAEPQQRSTHSQSSPIQRPFDHNRHERLSCRACHGTGEQHRTLLVRTSMDCARCHHDPARVGTCRDCHATPPEPGAVAVSLKLTVVDTARLRELPFEHRRHDAVACVNCHGTPVTLAPNRECASCHAEHHRPEANCSGCHSTINRVVHPRHSHMSCAGSGCHAPTVAPRPALSRNLCLTCHPEQRNHEPQGSCAACHGIPLNEL